MQEIGLFEEEEESTKAGINRVQFDNRIEFSPIELMHLQTQELTSLTSTPYFPLTPLPNLNRQSLTLPLHPLQTRLLPPFHRLQPIRKHQLQTLFPELILIRQLKDCAQLMTRNLKRVRLSIRFQDIDKTSKVLA